MTFDEVMSFYLSNKNHKSKWRDQCSLVRLQPFFTGRALADIRRADVRAYIRKRQVDGVKLATVRRELRLFSAAVNYSVVELELQLPNPARALGLPEPEGRVRWITKSEATSLIAEAGRFARRPHLQQFVRLALNTGCRKSELLLLEWSRVDLSRAVFVLNAEHTKSGKRRSVALNAGAVAALRTLRDWQNERCPYNPWVFGVESGRPITTFKTGWAGACRRAGLYDFRIHDMRHTCASWLVMSGISLTVVRDVLGHSSVAVTERYAHLAPDLLREAVACLPDF